ncbi:MAG: gas vesicle protein GvpG [Chloroflexi bacterium]|nr:gas vesicle protein GvpG [Chloroflexota bacterium]
MRLLWALLTLPVLGAPRLMGWLATPLAERAQQDALERGWAARGQLLELQERYEEGTISEEEYQREEEALLTLLDAFRERADLDHGGPAPPPYRDGGR